MAAVQPKPWLRALINNNIISFAAYKLEGQAELSAFLIEFYRVSLSIETRR
jgi:hypothetical protein